MNHSRIKALFFHLGTNFRLPPGPIMIDGQGIELPTQFKILGMVSSSKLSRKHRIEMISKRLSSTAGIIYKCRNTLNYKWLMTIYHIPFILCVI